MRQSEEQQAQGITKERALEIFRMGMENQRFLDQIVASAKPVALFFLACFIFCKKRDIDGSTLALINGKHQNKLFQKYVVNKSDVTSILHGRFFSSPLALRSACTIYSGTSRWERLRCCRHAYQAYRDAFGKSNGQFWDYLEYSFIKALVERSNVRSVLLFGHYDRYSTWLSHLAHAMGKQVEIHQHGLVSSLQIPQRIHCDNLFCYTDKQRELFARYIVRNESCCYTLTGFTTVAQFEEYIEKDGVLIGIAGERNPEECISTAHDILALLPAAKVIIMPHPGESINTYQTLLASEQASGSIVVELLKRYSNIDVLVSRMSSLVYDYLAQGYQGVIVAVKNNVLSYDIDEHVDYRVVESMADVPEVIRMAMT